jgi:hypothetical protein
MPRGIDSTNDSDTQSITTSTLMMEAGKFSEPLVFTSTLTRLIARENVSAFIAMLMRAW